MIFDTHIHLNDEAFINNLDFYLEEAKKEGVTSFLCIGYDYESSTLAVELASKYPNIYAAIGFIPTEHKKWDDSSISKLKKLYNLNPTKIKAIGEIGLDYYWEKEENIKIRQQEMFIKQIELANELNLPISIHSRDSILDTLNILKEHKVLNRGIMHCYSGSKESAIDFIKEGFLIAFNGVLTFKNSKKTKETLLNIPIDMVVFETDAPYLAPHPYRGKINEPKYIKETVRYASELLNISIEELEKITFANSLRILKINYETN